MGREDRRRMRASCLLLHAASAPPSYPEAKQQAKRCTSVTHVRAHAVPTRVANTGRAAGRLGSTPVELSRGHDETTSVTLCADDCEAAQRVVWNFAGRIPVVQPWSTLDQSGFVGAPDWS
eukprot:scaffold599_cov282-Pinguiococcus_pyrenoidosus.AAC.4